MGKENYQEEFQEIGQLIRHYSNLRFAVLTVFLGFLGGAVTIGANLQIQAVSSFYILSIKAAGLLGTLVFWYFEWRIGQTFVHLEKRVEKLEKKLGYKTYTGRLSIKLKTPYIMTILYGIVFIFWILSFFLG